MFDEDKVARWGLLAGVAFVVLAAVSAFIAGSPPKLDDADTKIVAYFTDHQDALRIGSYLGGLANVAFLWFLGSLFGRIRRAEGGAGRMAGVALTGAVAAIAVTFIANGIGAYVALHPESSPFGYRLSSVLFGYTGFAIAVFTAGVSVVLWNHGLLPKWFGYLGEAIAVAWFVAAAVVTTENETIFTIGFIVFIVWAVWVAALSIQLYRTPE